MGKFRMVRARATEHLAAIRAIIAAQIGVKKHAKIKNLFGNIKVRHAGENFAVLLFIQYFDNRMIRQFFAVPPVSN